jgi:hypothetical protein
MRGDLGFLAVGKRRLARSGGYLVVGGGLGSSGGGDLDLGFRFWVVVVGGGGLGSSGGGDLGLGFGSWL